MGSISGFMIISRLVLQQPEGISYSIIYNLPLDLSNDTPIRRSEKKHGGCGTIPTRGACSKKSNFGISGNESKDHLYSLRYFGQSSQNRD